MMQSGDAKTYISEFMRLSVMVPDLSIARRVYMFIDGQEEPLHGLVKFTKPITCLRGKKEKLLLPRRAI